MKDKLMEICHLTFGYEEGRDVLHDINVSFYKQERIAVLGANGAGKTTFFLHLNGVREPTGGEIRYRGEQILKRNKNILRKKVGIVFQDPDQQIIASTVKAEVAFGPMNMKLSREEVEARAMKAIGDMNLSDHALRPPHYLSGGEKKRVSIADIIAMDTEIMIFDEPTASLDPVNVQILEEALNKMEQQGKTILLSTHDVDFAYRFADRILVFGNGMLIGDGGPDTIFRDKGLLEQANLRKPVLMEVYDMLRGRGILKETDDVVKDLTGLALLLDTIEWQPARL